MERNKRPHRRGDTRGAHVEGSTQRHNHTTPCGVAARFGSSDVLRDLVIGMLSVGALLGVVYGALWLCYIVGKAVGTV